MIRVKDSSADAARVARRVEAVAKTLELGEDAEVFLGPRPSRSWDEGRVPNEMIAQKSRRRGRPPFFLPARVKRQAQQIISRGLRKATERAFKTKRPVRWSAAKLASVQHVAHFFRTRITSGHLGTNKPTTAAIKKALVKIGRATGRWGVPPPYLVSSGRFVSSIRSRIVRGRRNVR